MKYILGIAAGLVLLLTPAKLSFIKPIYNPTYPICIMQVGGTEYLLLAPGGEVVKDE